MHLVGKEEKTCEACLKALPLQSFYPHKKGGHSALCKSCTVADNRLRRQDPEGYRLVLEARRVSRAQAKASLEAAVQTKGCCKCGAQKGLDEFRPHRGLYGRSSWCRECERQYTREWTDEHRDEHNAKRRETWASTEFTPEQRAEAAVKSRVWYAANRERALANFYRWVRENTDSYNAIQAKRRVAKLEGLCTLTSEEWEMTLSYFNRSCAYCLRSDVALTMDHLVPVSRGGAHTQENVVPACRSCNSKKGNRSILTMVAA